MWERLGHWTRLRAFRLTIPPIRSEKLDGSDECSFTFTQDAKLRFTGVPPRTHKLAVVYAALSRLCKSAVFKYTPSARDFQSDTSSERADSGTAKQILCGSIEFNRKCKSCLRRLWYACIFREVRNIYQSNVRKLNPGIITPYVGTIGAIIWWLCSTAPAILEPTSNPKNESWERWSWSDYTSHENLIIWFAVRDEFDIAKEGLAYVTGYVAFRLRNKYPDLGRKTKNLEKDDDKEGEFAEISEWIALNFN